MEKRHLIFHGYAIAVDRSQLSHSVESQKPAKNEVWAITSACCLFHIDINGCLWGRGISMFTLPILPCYWPTQCAMSHSLMLLFTLFIYNLPPFLSQKKPIQKINNGYRKKSSFKKSRILIQVQE